MKRTLFYSGKTYIGIDNGVTGSIGVVPFSGVDPLMINMPIFNVYNYTKAAQKIHRIETNTLHKFLSNIVAPFAIIERPMVNPARFKATQSALRALEATLIILEKSDIPYQFIDSKQWQKVMLPKGVKGSAKLKEASLSIGKRLFPQFSTMYKKDADGILIAEWARRSRL